MTRGTSTSRRRGLLTLLWLVASTATAMTFLSGAMAAGAAVRVAAGSIVADRFTQTFPLTKQTLTVVKYLDADGNATLTATDAQGAAVDYYAAEAAEKAAQAQQFGKIDHRLAKKLTALDKNAKVGVSIWVAPSVVFEPRRAPGTTPGEALAAAQAANSAVQEAVAADLQQAGAAVTAARFSPVVSGKLNRGQIMKIARRGDVAQIYANDDYSLDQEDAATTERANSIWAARNLGFGTSSRPAVHEPDGVSDGNPYLSNATHPVIFYCASVNSLCPSGKLVGSPSYGGHASRVAGAIASTHPLLRGIAPNVQLIVSENSQTFNNTDLVAANEWGRGNGADPTNMSWGETCPSGSQTFFSRYIDYAVRYLDQTFTISSGNTRGCGSDFMVSAPGTAWTAITVGAIRDSNDGFWTNDGMSTFSRYVNPTFAAGMEKPEVVAVGEDLCLTNDTDTDCGNAGTSFAAPQIAGQVASMLARRPGQNIWPETNKAAVLASAYHDVAPGTSQDGLGAVVMSISDDTYRLGRFFNICGSTCDPVGTADFGVGGNIERTADLTSGQRVKVAIAWDADSTGGNGTDVLGADLDLSVLGPSNEFLCGSASVQNAWESCEFTVAVTGTYTFRVHLSNSEAAWPGTFIGLAWSVRAVPSLCSAPLKTIMPGATVAFTTANGPTFYDAYNGWPRSQSGREQVLRFVNTTPRTLTFGEAPGSDPSNVFDLHLVQIPSCGARPIVPTVLAHGTSSVSSSNAPAGTYYLIVDGLNGAVGADSITLTAS